MDEPQTFPRPLMQSAGLRVVVLDQLLRIMAIRGTGFAAVGRRHPDIGKSFSSLLPFLEVYRDRLHKVAQSGEPFDLSRLRCEARVLDFKGYFSLHACASQTGRGVILLLQEVSLQAEGERDRLQERNELRIARRQLEHATAEAHAANRAKSTFLAHVSHELKTPLAVITGNADILCGMKLAFRDEQERKELEQEIRDYAHDIRESGEFLASLVTDLLDIVRAETGRFSLNETMFDLVDLAEEVVNTLKRLPAASDVELSNATDIQAVDVYGDPIRLRQVVVNLLTNAVHASNGGGKIELRIDRLNDGGIETEILDRGNGIDPMLETVIFEPFAGGKGGTGLGLTIAKNLIEQHGGEIGIENREGGGTRAWFRLPSERVRFE